MECSIRGSDARERRGEAHEYRYTESGRAHVSRSIATRGERRSFKSAVEKKEKNQVEEPQLQPRDPPEYLELGIVPCR